MRVRVSQLPFFLSAVAGAVSILIVLVGAAAPDVKAIASAVDAHYNHLKTLEADFTEVYQGAFGKWNALVEKTWQDALGVSFSY